ncbi:hypothetical protein V1509DRAFT_629470 [Lipomyces kononenkoae]
MTHPHHLSPCALLQDANPEAILLASSLPPNQIRSLLDSTSQSTELHAHIIQASELLEYIGTQIDHMKTWKCDWEDLCTESAVSELKRHCYDIRADACRYDVEVLKKTVLALDGHSRVLEALLTALMFRLLVLLNNFEILLVTYETRSEVSRLHLLVQHELSEISLHHYHHAKARITKAGSILDHLIELSREPVPESWIDEVESMEERVAKISVPDVDPETGHSSQPDIRAGDVEDDDVEDARRVSGVWVTQLHGFDPEFKRSQIEGVTGKQALKQEDAAEYQHHKELDDVPSHLSLSVVRPPSSSTSTLSSHDDDNTDPTEDLGAYTQASPVPTTIKSPKWTDVSPEMKPLEASSDAQLPVERISLTHSPTSIETIHNIQGFDLESTQRQSISPSSTTGSPIQFSRQHRADSIDNEYPLQQRNPLEDEILVKDRYRGQNLRSGHAHDSLPSVELDENDPKRLSMNVPSLRGTLATAKMSDGGAMSPQHTLDLKIRHILTTLPASDVNIEPAEQQPAPITNSSTYKLMTITKSSSLQEAGYGQTRKYLLHRPNAPPQVIWVRIVAERVMVRVGGGWTDLAEWLSNYIRYHSSRGSPLNVADPGTPNSKLTPSPRSNGLQVNKLSNDTASPSPGSGSRYSMSSPQTSLSATSRGSNTSNRNARTPTPLGMAGPVSSLAKGKMSNEKKAWVQKMLRQVGVGEPNREEKNVSRQLFVSEDK